MKKDILIKELASRDAIKNTIKRAISNLYVINKDKTRHKRSIIQFRILLEAKMDYNPNNVSIVNKVLEEVGVRKIVKNGYYFFTNIMVLQQADITPNGAANNNGVS